MSLLLKLENLVIALVALSVYSMTGAGWTLFLLLVLVPDLAILAYFGGPRAGAVVYNVTHSFIGAGVLLVAGAFFEWTLTLPIAMIWIFHIGIDRALGYGLKHMSGFNDTHLGRIGKSAGP